MSDAKHTPALRPDHVAPLPWSVGPGYGGRPAVYASDDSLGESSRDVLEELTPAEAEFIVRACNSHADLLAACDKALGYVRYTLEFFDWSRFQNLETGVEQLRDELDAAIRKAKGESE